MTAPAQTALDFCRECLGWERPVDRRFAEQNLNAIGDGPSRAWTPYVFDFYGKHGQFHYTDLNAVMEAVRGWCSKNAFFLSTCTTPTLGEVSAQVFRVGVRVEACHPEFCHALLAACVEANRKLKAG